MSLRYKGGVISATPPTTTGGESGTAPGVWTLEQQMQAQAASLWPSAPPIFGSNMRSLRFNSDDSAYLTRTPASAGNRKTWTWSGWVKLSSNKNQQLFNCVGAQNDTQATFIDFLSTGVFRVTGWNTVWRGTAAVYRDFSAWYHVVVAFDTTQATGADRVKVYINGSQVTNFSSSNDPTQNTDYGINQAALHEIGRYTVSGTGYDYLGGYMTEIVFVDGQALTPSSFGQTNSTTGVWEPKAITGLTYGTNGFYLKFQDNSGTTATTLGKDSSGNGNNWTPNNFSVTAGVGNDSLVDTPYLYGTDTGAGGEVRGNYCTLNPLDTSVFAGSLALSNGNLQVAGTNESAGVKSTFFVSSGKWYWEGTLTSGSTDSVIGIGQAASIYYPGYSSTSYAYRFDGNKLNNDSSSSYGASYTTNDVIGIALDLDAGTLVFYKNGSSQGTAYSSLSGNFTPHFGASGGGNSTTWVANFGQRPFAYTAPSGFKALNTQNLPTPTIGATATTRADDYFNTVLYTGTGATRSITGVGFAPDFVWNKGRSNAVDHCLNDIVRGANKQLVSNTTDAELTYTNQLTSFDSDGFSLGADNLGYTNYNNVTYAAWCWKGGGTGVSNTAGTVTSTVSANTTAGFSVVTYTGTGSNATVGHGLGATPGMIIIKNRSTTTFWAVYHAANTSAPETDYLLLNSTAATADDNTYWNDTAPTSTLFSIGTDNRVNGSTNNMVAYCFAPVAGFSAFGTYTGNGNADGPFVYTGFRPRWVLFKRTDTANNWFILDTARDTYNALTNYLSPDLSSTESTASNIADFVSNGFKVRGTSTYYGFNASGGTYIYAAFAENPFKYSLAR
jgi:hypothetical protein